VGLLLYAATEGAPLLTSVGLSQSDLARFASPEGVRPAMSLQRIMPLDGVIHSHAALLERDMVRSDL
jgi:hypothetical protein